MLMRRLSIFFYLFIIACQDSNSNRQNSKNDNKQQVIKETSPKARFEQFLAHFSTVKLPYASNNIDNFKRLDDRLIERVLGIKNDPKFGLNRSINCMATFKVHDFIAVIYQSTERPNTEHSPTYTKIALYTPYGALKGEKTLGKNQQTEDFTEQINLFITPNFTIRVEHNIDAYVPLNTQLNSYHSFYFTEYKLGKSGKIQLTKEAALWEKIPEEFVAPFVFEQKKMPASSTTFIEHKAQKTTLKSNGENYSQVIVQTFLDSLIFVSSLEMEPTETATDSFYVNSKVAIIQLQQNRLQIVSPQFIPSSAWTSVYKAIQKNCRCSPAPTANENGIISLTLLETPLQNAVFANLNLERQVVEFICNQAGNNADTSFYAIPIKD